MGDQQDGLGFLISDVARLLRKRFDRRAAELGLTRAQWRALGNLARDEGMIQSHLADLLEVEKITLARLVDRLECAGWVERRADADDRRMKRLYLTDKARPILAQMKTLADEVRAEMLAGIEPEEREQLRRLLGRMKDNMTDDDKVGPAVRRGGRV